MNTSSCKVYSSVWKGGGGAMHSSCTVLRACIPVYHMQYHLHYKNKLFSTHHPYQHTTHHNHPPPPPHQIIDSLRRQRRCMTLHGDQGAPAPPVMSMHAPSRSPNTCPCCSAVPMVVVFDCCLCTQVYVCVCMYGKGGYMADICVIDWCLNLSHNTLTHTTCWQVCHEERPMVPVGAQKPKAYSGLWSGGLVRMSM